MSHASDHDECETELQDALGHLHDPLYRPSPELCALAGVDAGQGMVALRQVLIDEIDRLAPAPSVPPAAPARRLHELLSLRYLQGLTQETASERLGFTPRYLREMQQKAVHLLAVALQRRAAGQEVRGDDHRPSAETHPAGDASAWARQVRDEVLWLQRTTPEAIADVGTEMQRAGELARHLVEPRGIAVEVGPVATAVAARIHPSALRQVLLATIRQLAEHGQPARIRLDAQNQGTVVAIGVTRCPASRVGQQVLSGLAEIVAAYGGEAEFHGEGNASSLQIRLPAPRPTTVTVLIVDDNSDLASVYVAYLAGTRYQPVHLREGQRTFEAVETYRPQIVVLDVMLPDVDGWDLLVQLHGSPATRSLPVVVCSVIRDQEMALSLGAAGYLTKPVRRQQMIQALDEALNRAASASQPSGANSATTC